MFTDLVLASAHHILVFALLAVLACEMMLVRPGLSGATIARVARIDIMFGLLALAVLLVGIARLVWGLKGWDAYSGNVWFWHKMGVFALVGLISIVPTLRILRWKKGAAEPGFVVPDAELRSTRRMLHIEAGLFLLIPVFAAAMARYGA